MRIVDFQISKCRRRLSLWQHRVLLAVALDVDEVLVTVALDRVRRERRNIDRLKIRTRQVQGVYLNLNALSDYQCLKDFRFRKADIGGLCERFSWPGISARNEYRCDRVTAMCSFLFRLATNCRWYDHELKFGMFTSQLSEIFWEHVELSVELYGHVLRFRPGIMQARANLYAEVLRQNNCPLDSCVGFIDCTKIRMTRPGGHGSNQRSCYSGHKRMHCLIHQSLSTPDGLIYALYGPVEGRRHDLTVLRQSNWEDVMEGSLVIDGIQYYIYGDSAYLLRPWMQRPFVREFATNAQLLFNTEMSSLRVLVEHNYRDLKQLWTSQDYARNLKVRQAPIGLLYQASAIMLNFRTCLYRGGQTVERLGLNPPTLDEYIAFE